MQGIQDRTTASAAEREPSRGRRSAVAVAVAAAVAVGGVTAVVASGVLDDPREAVRVSAPETVDVGAGAPAGEAPVDAPAQVPVEQAPVEPAPAGPAPAEGASQDDPAAEGTDGPAPTGSETGAPDGRAAVPAGRHDVQVLDEGWDARGRYLVVDRGRLTDGPPVEPGVDGTRPVVFDTGGAAERLRLDLAERYSLQFARVGGEPSYGSGSWADLVTALGGRDAAMLATVEVDGQGRLVSLEEPYRP